MSVGFVALILIGLLVLAAFSALFSAIETALFSLQPHEIDRLKRRRAGLGRSVSQLMENPRRLLSAMLLADSLVNLPLIVLGAFALRVASPWPVPWWGAALIVWALIVFVCDLIPKLLALSQTYRIAQIGVRVMQLLMPVFDPSARVLQRFSEWVAEKITPRWLQPIPFLSEDELETLIDLSAEEGALHETESEMIQEIIKLGDKTARDCMTPRVDMVAIPDDLANEELIPRLRDARLRRVPVYGETPDDLLGVLDVQAFLLDPAVHYTERLTPPSFVAETMKALDLLRSFLSHPQAIAFVVDEHGGIEGLVTLADLVEEIISDALPDSERELYLEVRDDGTMLASGDARLEDIAEHLITPIEEEGIDTIGGLIFNRLGAVPKLGTQLEIDGLRITVQRTTRKRVEEVLIVPPAPPPDIDLEEET
ncbi:MAG: hemolysin family protein [Chthoniobacteraceae bacterium]